MAISKEKKNELVAGYVDKLRRCQGIVISEYRGMNVAQVSALRAKLREVNSQYTITKNTLFKLALRQVGMAAPDDLFIGPVAVSFAFGELTGLIKTLQEEAKNEETPLTLKGGIVSQSVLDVDGLEQLTRLPSLEVLRAQLLGLIAAPAVGAVSLLQEPARGVVGALNAASTQVLNVLAAYTAKAEQPAA